MSRTSSAERRIRRELDTVRAMVRIYCRDNHAGGAELCEECRTLWDYARRRVECCPFRSEKPTCLNCAVHCFQPSMRERIRTVMRYAGPRMPWRHPLLALLHVLDGKRKPKKRIRK
jgi:hypothetical protein